MSKKGNSLFIAICTVPAFALFLLFFAYPLFKAFLMAFYRWSGLTANTEEFVGFDNFIQLADDRIFKISILNNLVVMLIVPATVFVLSIFLAVLVTRFKLKEHNLYRVVFFFPNILSTVVVSLVWFMIYNPAQGILNGFLKVIGLENLARGWLGDPKTALLSVAATIIWANIGFYFILFMAGIQGIPTEYYEAAVIDGAGQVAQFFNITLPLLWEIVRLSIVMLIGSAAFGCFNYVFVMTNGGPDSHTEVIISYMYRQAFTNGNMGYATAIGLIAFILSLVLVVISNAITKRESIEY